jgi:4-amino-4-deoxy-L-arabinose transferase-like glycosyltransferase
MTDHNTQETSIPSKVFLPPLIVGTVVALLNLQWMQIYQLLNAPQADSLVYLTESFSDYWSMRNGDFYGQFEKYVLRGGQQTSPLLWWLAAFSYFLFGVYPVNAYLVVALIYLLWVAGVTYLAWSIVEDSKYALACGLMAAFLPSVAAHGLRNFMLDFVAAAPFIWATAFLIKSDLGFKRREVIIYAILCGITILFRTTLVPYFISHIIIIFLLAVSQKRHPHYRNIGLTVLVGGLTCGWFIFPNLKRIFGYYGYWASQAEVTGSSTSFLSNLGFYLNLVQKFHLKELAASIALAICLIASGRLAYMFIKGVLEQEQVKTIKNALIILLPLALVSTVILSLYSSRAATVDYPYIAVYLMVPPLLWRMSSKNTGIFWVGAGAMILSLAGTQANYLILSPSKEVADIDFREREVLQMILDDAEINGMKNIVIGNTPIHQHNSLSYKYWILGNYFPRWHDRVNGATIGRTNSAEALAKMNSEADYVITAENYQANWHPNNVVAPKANSILKNLYGMIYMPRSFDVPEGVKIKILKNQKPHVTLSKAETDGWHQDNVPVTIRNPKHKPIKLKISGNLFQGNLNSKFAAVTLSSASNLTKQLTLKTNSKVVDLAFPVPIDFFDKKGMARLTLQSSWAGQPSSISNSSDTRNLAFQNLKLLVKEEIK